MSLGSADKGGVDVGLLSDEFWLDVGVLLHGESHESIGHKSDVGPGACPIKV